MLGDVRADGGLMDPSDSGTEEAPPLGSNFGFDDDPEETSDVELNDFDAMMDDAAGDET
jgi:hypothetical protein